MNGEKKIKQNDDEKKLSTHTHTHTQIQQTSISSSFKNLLTDKSFFFFFFDYYFISLKTLKISTRGY